MTITHHRFPATRRLILQGAASVALVGLGNIPFSLAPAFAAANDKYPEDAFKAKSDADAIKSLYGKTAEPSDKVKLDAPEIAENGAVVPISVSRRWPTSPRSRFWSRKIPTRWRRPTRFRPARCRASPTASKWPRPPT